MPNGKGRPENAPVAGLPYTYIVQQLTDFKKGYQYNVPPLVIRNMVVLGPATNEAGANYFISQFSFGDLTQEEVLHSAGIFARAVLPA